MNQTKQNEYLVENEADWDSIYIVSAVNAKDAINQVFEQHYEWRNAELKKQNKEWGEPLNYIYKKSDLKARNISDLHKESGSIVMVR